MIAKRTAGLAAPLSVAFLVAAAGCDENPPESAYETPTPFPSPSPAPTPVAVTVPGDGALVQFSGRIRALGEAHLYTVVLTAGERLRLDVDAQGMIPSSSKLDGLLTVYAPTGEVLAIADDGTNLWEASTLAPGALKDPYLVVEATSTGTYTVVFEDANGGGENNEEWDYRLAFSLAQPAALAGGLACADAVPLPALSGTGSVVSIAGSIAGTSTDTCCNTQVLPCVGTRVGGPDVTYLASLTSNQRIQITRTGKSFDGAVYITTDCAGGSNPSIIDSCVAGGDGSDDADGFVFTAPVTGSYFLFVDGGVTGGQGAFTLDLRRMP